MYRNIHNNKYHAIDHRAHDISLVPVSTMARMTQTIIGIISKQLVRNAWQIPRNTWRSDHLPLRRISRDVAGDMYISQTSLFAVARTSNIVCDCYEIICGIVNWRPFHCFFFSGIGGHRLRSNIFFCSSGFGWSFVNIYIENVIVYER